MKQIITGLLALSMPVALFSQVNIYDARTLPEDLVKKASSIKRDEKLEFNIRNFEDASYKVHRVITVLNKSAEEELYFSAYSDEFRKLEDAQIKVYNATGKMLNEYKKREMRTFSIGDGLVRDGQVTLFQVAAPSYPITVQYDYTVHYKGTLIYPDYEISTPNQAVENSVYTAVVPENLDMRFMSKNIDIKPTVKNSGKDKVYTWQVKNFQPLVFEEGSARGGAGYPQVMMAPNKFSMDGYDGDLSSWKNFGMWYVSLTKDAGVLPDATVLKLKEMVKSTSSEKEKVKIIYKYLQQNCRYVSIQLGIGGFKPFPATFVDQKKYGDCKALSNYMQACLSAVGITSYQALINAQYNREAVDPGFPHDNFNHVILCVPLKNDTTWLECTSNTNDFGVLGTFTENKNALLITPTGGLLISTPKSLAEANTSTVSNLVKLNEDASGETVTHLKTTGEYKQDIINYVANEKKDDQLEFFVRHLGFIQPDEFELAKNIGGEAADLDVKMSIEKIPDFTAGSKMFLHPRIYKIWSGKLPDDTARSKSFYFECPFLKTDTTVYKLPENYTVETLPKARSKNFEYGSFTSNYVYDEAKNEVISYAQLQLTQNMIPPEKFTETRKFFSYVIDEYTEKIIIKPK